MAFFKLLYLIYFIFERGAQKLENDEDVIGGPENNDGLWLGDGDFKNPWKIGDTIDYTISEPKFTVCITPRQNRFE